MAQTPQSNTNAESAMQRKPIDEDLNYTPVGKFMGKTVIITGGDSGIGRATAFLFAKEKANIAIIYHSQDNDASDTMKRIEELGVKSILYKGDVGSKQFCSEVIQKIKEDFGRIDILINNAAEQHPVDEVTEITEQQLVSTFRTNIFSMFYLSQAVLPHLKKGNSIINTASITAYAGHKELLDYAATKGAIVSFTRSLALNLADEGIRVNAVAPGPIWTPLIPSTFPKEKVQTFGKDTPLGRAGQPYEVAPCFLFLASDEASYITGQTIHVNGGKIVEG